MANLECWTNTSYYLLPSSNLPLYACTTSDKKIEVSKRRKINGSMHYGNFMQQKIYRALG